MPRGGSRPGAGRKAGKTGPTQKTKALRRAITRRHDLTAARTIEEIRRIGLSDIGAIFDEAGHLRPIHTLPPEVRAAIASVKLTKKNLTAGDGVMEDVVEVKLWDKLRALEMAAKHHGLLTERVEVRGHITLEERIAHARRRLAIAKASRPAG